MQAVGILAMWLFSVIVIKNLGGGENTHACHLYFQNLRSVKAVTSSLVPAGYYLSLSQGRCVCPS